MPAPATMFTARDCAPEQVVCEDTPIACRVSPASGVGGCLREGVARRPWMAGGMGMDEGAHLVSGLRGQQRRSMTRRLSKSCRPGSPPRRGEPVFHAPTRSGLARVPFPFEAETPIRCDCRSPTASTPPHGSVSTLAALSRPSGPPCAQPGWLRPWTITSADRLASAACRIGGAAEPAEPP